MKMGNVETQLGISLCKPEVIGDLWEERASSCSGHKNRLMMIVKRIPGSQKLSEVCFIIILCSWSNNLIN